MPMLIVDESEFDKQVKDSGKTTPNRVRINDDPRQKYDAPITKIINPADSVTKVETNETCAVSGLIIPKPIIGRPTRALEVPESLRKVIADTSLVESARDVSEAFGISPSSISAYKNGATSTATYDNPDNSLANFVNNRKLRISRRAQKKLMLALDNITEPKLAEASVRVLAGVARDMSSIVSNMEPKQTAHEGNKVQFIMFQPQMKQVEQYEVIEVNNS